MKFEIYFEIDEKELDFTEEQIKFTKSSILGNSHRSLEIIRNIFIGDDLENHDILYRKFLDNSKIDIYVEKKDLEQEFRDLELDKETWKNIRY
ncbi:hypothetical protein LCGC14_0985070 [marine sediment metagenome]|uniref:Uncharacterized protein n=1 Tax=marine sediment metagenome TaxID=412755 RepID=A0A0F9N7H5_9ZZZZ|nr:hypothetical protein [bacterium]